MGSNESKEISEDAESKKLREIAEKEGSDQLKDYLVQNLQRWKEQDVNIALTGRTATGKSTYINKVCGVSPQDEVIYSRIGRENATIEPKPFPSPANNRVVYWDLPGVGTVRFKRENYAKDVQLEKYDMFLIFVDYAVTEDDEWLATELIKMNKPFCFVLSKADIAIQENGDDTDNVIRYIRTSFLFDLERSRNLKNKKLFIISSMEPSIGDWTNLLNYIEESLSFKYEAFVFSLAGITSSVIEKKKQILQSRITKVALAAAAVAAVPIPGLDVALNMGLITNEVSQYREIFGMKNLEPSISNRLKCSKYLVKEKSLPMILQANFPKYVGLMTFQSVTGIITPVIGSIISSATSLPIVYFMLKNILDMFVEDAYVLDAIIRKNVK